MNRTLITVAVVGGLGLVAFLVWRKMRGGLTYTTTESGTKVVTQSAEAKEAQATKVEAGVAKVQKASTIDAAIKAMDETFKKARKGENPANWAPALKTFAKTAAKMEADAIASGKSAEEARLLAVEYVRTEGARRLQAWADAQRENAKRARMMEEAAAKGKAGGSVAGLGMMRGVDLSNYMNGQDGYAGGGILGMRS